ncbi:hypothetical protein LEMLEM_LOCUS14392, partial [Lemmus lemmus]
KHPSPLHLLSTRLRASSSGIFCRSLLLSEPRPRQRAFQIMPAPTLTSRTSSLVSPLLAQMDTYPTTKIWFKGFIYSHVSFIHLCLSCITMALLCP